MKIYDPVLVGWGVDWWFLDVLGTDMKDKIAKNIEEVLEEIYLDCNIIEGMPKEDYNIDGLSKEIKETTKTHVPIIKKLHL